MGYRHLVFPENSLFLVTGGAGFIGSNICEAILEMGYRVRCLDDLSTGSQKNVDMFLSNPNYEFIKGDIKDFDTCMKACEGVDYVLNQAAWGSVPRSIEMPLFYEKNNIMGTLNMMEASRQNGVKKFVYASSSSVYGDEDDLNSLQKFCNKENSKLFFDCHLMITDPETYAPKFIEAGAELITFHLEAMKNENEVLDLLLVDYIAWRLKQRVKENRGNNLAMLWNFTT